MTRSQERDYRFKGEITAFLSLIFLLLLSIVAAAFSSMALQMEKSSQRARMTLALESVFAEYDREMLSEYELFVRANTDEAVLSERLQFYGIQNMTHEVTKKELLTDHQGAPFYTQAVRYMKDWMGMEETEQASAETFETDGTVERLEEDTSEELKEMLTQEEAELPREENPLENVNSLKRTGLLMIIAKEEAVSEKCIDTANLPSHRTLETGSGYDKVSRTAADKVLLTAYLEQHFSCAGEHAKERALSYELEYILCGKDSDRENLEQVLQKILTIRLAVNYGYLMTDEVKKAEAGALAAALCSLLTVPGITEIVKQSLLLAWAYGESIVDLRVLMQDKEVAPVKTEASWQLKLENLAKLGTKDEISQERPVSDGIGYSDYVKGFLLLTDSEKLCMRSLDLIENQCSVRVDRCITKVEVTSECVLQKQIRDRFQTEFQYQ